MPFDINDPDTKAAFDEAIEKATAPLLAKRNELLSEVKKLKKGVEVDPAEVERLEGELEKAQGQLADANKQLKATTKTAEDTAKAYAAEQAHTQRLLIDNGLSDALTGAGVKDPFLLKAASALLRDTYKPIVSADGEKRVAMIGDKPLADFVKEWAGGAEGKTFAAAPAHSGGGAAGGAVQKPTTGDVGGTPAQRAAAYASKFPELAQ